MTELHWILICLLFAVIAISIPISLALGRLFDKLDKTPERAEGEENDDE